MARARLHIICGNCGCNDEFEFHIDPKGHDMTDKVVKFESAVYISCNNCSTLHDLSETIEDKTTSQYKG